MRARDENDAIGTKLSTGRDRVRPVESLSVQSTQLVQLLHWLLPLVLCFAVLEAALFVSFGDRASGGTAAVLLSFGALLLVARVQLRQGRLPLAVALVCAPFLAATLVMAAINPSLVPTLVVSPLMAVAVALPYVGSRLLRLLIVAAWVVVTIVGVSGELITSQSTLPSGYEGFFRVASLSTATAVVLLLLWQFRTRLMGTLEQARAAEDRLQREATHDTLTGLPNRALLNERLSRTIERSAVETDYAFAILFLDLDRFKNVNDSLGHGAGDLLLQEIASRLRARVRPTDTVARLGGDEFVMLLEDLGGYGEDAAEVAQEVQETLRTPFVVEGQEIFTTASIGVVRRPSGYGEPEELLRDADIAMYRAKEAGKARHTVFEAPMRRRPASLLRLETDLRRAVARTEFEVHYQPIVALGSGEITGFEALVRWRHHRRGLLGPDAFIPLAEETGLIFAITRFVLREACGRMALWRQRLPDYRPLTVSVNVTPAQLAHPEFPQQLSETLAHTGLEGRDLALEITEGALVRDERIVLATLSRIKRLEARVHVDDFGTGYSSLAALHRYPVDALKIDQSFVSGMEFDREKPEIVQTIASLAYQLGMVVVAEGVETNEQLALLRKMGCDYGQGYLFSRPITSGAAEALLEAAPRW